jgi:hypothetical protein
MSARTTFKDWSKETLRLSGRQPCTLYAEASPGVMYLAVKRDSDGRQWNTEIATDDAAREVLSGLVIAFPHLF